MSADAYSPFIAGYSPGVSGPEIRVRIFRGTLGGSTLTGPEIVALIDAELGSTDWQTGGTEKFVNFGPTLPDPMVYTAASGTAAFTKTNDADGVSIGNWITDSTSWVLPGGQAASPATADNFVQFGTTLPDPRTYVAGAGVATFTKITDDDGVSIGNYITDGTSWILPHDNN